MSMVSQVDGTLNNILPPCRGSFARHCLQTVVSKMGMEIEVVYYERVDGVLQKVAELMLYASDAPLSQIFNEELPERFDGLSGDSDLTIRCYAGNIEGQEIDLSRKPNEIDYVIDALRNQMRPVLFLCREPADEDSSAAQERYYEQSALGRTASGVVQDFLDIHSQSPSTPTTPTPLASPSPESPSTPPTSGSAASEDAVFLSHEAPKKISKSHSILRKLRTIGKSRTVSHVPVELYESQNDRIASGGSSSSNGSHDDTLQMFAMGDSSSASLPSQSDLFDSGGIFPDVFGPLKSVRFKDSGKKFGDFLTLQRRPWKNRRQSPLSTKSRLFEADISPPSPTNPAFAGATEHGMKWTRKSALKKKKRKVSSLGPPIPETSYAFQIKSVCVTTEDGATLEIPCKEHDTIGELKEAVAQQLNKQEQGRAVPWRSSNLTLIYTGEDGVKYELFNSWQFIYKTSLYDAWARLQCQVPLTVQSASRDAEKDLPVVSRISKLAGVVMDDRIVSLPGADMGDLRRIAAADQREAQWARKTLHSFVACIANCRDPEGYALSMEYVTTETSTILALKIPIDNKIEITFHYKQCFSLVKRISVQRYADSVLAEVFPCVVACGLVENRMEDYTLQKCGVTSYIAGRNELIMFRDIRRCIIQGEPIHLSVTEKPSVKQDLPCKLNWLPIDPLSGVPPLHTDITHSSPRDCEVQALSVWDREDDFTLRLVKSDNLPPLGKSSHVVVEATLYYGDKPLCPTVTTATHILGQTVRWKANLNFKIKKKNIPKAAKVMFVIREPTQRRESANTRKMSKFLYWGLTTVFDHQGMLHNGERPMSLWRGRKDGAEDYYKPNPSGPASNNTDPWAVTLLVKFDGYGFPVYYPSSAPQSWSLLLDKQESANVSVRRQFQRLLEFIREGRLHSAVPAYIQKVNWGSLSESLEVYSLLDQLADARQAFPVETALKLLDCDFPDENVRAFATRVLEQLSDEQLEDFLLQLTQALKFELNHDSFMARFLLKRALRNKRIGHFFFWYLKCEMYNPQYTTRFGVILEAYLKGCGEAMLKEFEHQVEMQTKLEEIGKELKQCCNDDHGKMQAMLPEMLESHSVTSLVFTPVYNPRIHLGNLRPMKCKIMTSKKKPQWLEMSNIDPTALKQTPTRLILKLGDDLRQDMITLRMFSLFEKLWEEEGLDLCLIPYGCMATGPKTGFIEVVKNAKTIAEVSGVSNNTKLYEWIKNHQKNEFGEIDTDKVKEAVKTFTHSCAGYSVATYVLGIGDRHNDNIMVTTSGNLFHIDFGHFLGNIKYCMGFKREWAPFVLTPDFVYAMGGEGSSTFETYKNLCCRAFLTLRRHADLIINLFSMMRSTGIPELTCVEDTDYIRNALLMDKNEHEAEQLFQKVIKKCLDLKWTVQVMWKIHLLRRSHS